MARQEGDNQSIIADPNLGGESEEEGNSDPTPVEGQSEDEAEGFGSSSRAGRGYSGEIQGELKGWQAKTEAQKKAVVTSGGQLPYLHMPIEGYSGPEGLTEYKYEIITALEKGLDRANEL